jgi:hypothetical protein
VCRIAWRSGAPVADSLEETRGYTWGIIDISSFTCERERCQDGSHGTSISRNSSVYVVGMHWSRRTTCDWRMYRVGWVGKKELGHSHARTLESRRAGNPPITCCQLGHVVHVYLEEVFSIMMWRARRAETLPSHIFWWLGVHYADRVSIFYRPGYSARRQESQDNVETRVENNMGVYLSEY